VHVPLHAKLVILAAVLISMVTTFLTIRQSQRRGMMPAATPDNPMGGAQKYMTYIMPFFALTGLYWPFGLVLYWVTTNVWTLGQQFILGRRYPYTPPAADDSKAEAAPAAKPATAGARFFGGKAQQSQASDAQNGSRSAGGAQSGSRSARGPVNGAATSANGSGGVGGMLKRLGKGRAEPAPQAEGPPDVKVVRRQTQRKSRSKRTGKR
jgi:YidC/Oxa1 family membrane protein insertase